MFTGWAVFFTLAQGVAATPVLTWDNVKALISFGDSYTAVEGTRGTQGVGFAGDLSHLAFTPQEILSDAIVQAATSTPEGGPNYVEYLTGCGLTPGSTLPRSCSKELWDFAFAGADISQEFLPLHHDYTISYVNQVHQYTTYGHTTISHNGDKQWLASTLVSTWIGINDMNDSGHYKGSFPDLFAKYTARIFTALDAMCALDYQQFLILDMPPLDKRPGNPKTHVGQPSLSEKIAWWQTALKNSADNFAASHPNAVVRFYDAHTALEYIWNNAASYGIKNLTSFCPDSTAPDIATNYAAYGCGPLDQYYWFDQGHLTSHVHSIFSGFLKSFLASTKLTGWN